MLQAVEDTDSVNLSSTARSRTFNAESAADVAACHHTPGMRLMQDKALSPVEFLAPWHFGERVLRIRVARLPSRANALGTEVDIFGMIVSSKRRRQQPDDMHTRRASVSRHRGYFRIGAGLGRQLLLEFRDDMTELVDLFLTPDVAHRPARILKVLLAAQDAPDAVRLRTVRSPHMHREDQSAAARVIVEHGFDGSIGENASVPVKLAINPYRREGRWEGTRGHDMPDRQRGLPAVEIMHLACPDVCGTQGQPGTSGI